MEDLLKLNDEVYKLYQEMDSEEKRYLFAVLSGYIGGAIKHTKAKSIDIEELLNFVKNHIEEQK